MQKYLFERKQYPQTHTVGATGYIFGMSQLDNSSKKIRHISTSHDQARTTLPSPLTTRASEHKTVKNRKSYSNARNRNAFGFAKGVFETIPMFGTQPEDTFRKTDIGESIEN